MNFINQYKVGVGITSYNRPEMLEKCLSHIHKFTGDHTLYVAVDKDDDRQGVAKRKNECLRALKDCDYIFLLDDDCYPVSKGWVEYFVEKLKYPLTRHLLYLNDKMHYKMNSNHVDGCYLYKECGGVFMALTKEIINNIGGFNEEFELWGFEHAEYSQRIHIGKMCYYPYMCAKDTDKYLYAEDYNNPMHKSSITNEEKNYLFNKNKSIFAQPITTIYRPL